MNSNFRVKVSLAAALAIAAIVPLRFIPRIHTLPPEFRYEADIFSQDDFYDAEKERFLGPQISKTRFFYEVESVKDEMFLIRNVFAVYKMTGEPIFSVERKYGIDPNTGTHVKGYGDKDREGYLFAPWDLKKQSYVYWHINYDNPAELSFKKVEKIRGLKVYQYECDYGADQTSNLGHLPGVPEERGVNLDINLKLWLEPVSGRMVKYEDNTLAWYYDIKTGERIHPWNRFQNRYTPESLTKQVRLAQRAKWKILTLRFVVPSIFLLVALGVLATALRKKKKEAGDSEEK